MSGLKKITDKVAKGLCAESGGFSGQESPRFEVECPEEAHFVADGGREHTRLLSPGRPHPYQATVLGIFDKLRGEIVGAVVRLKEGETATEHEFRLFCSERMSGYKVPKQIIFLDSLPRTAGGSFDKEGIRRRLSLPSPFPQVAIS